LLSLVAYYYKAKSVTPSSFKHIVISVSLFRGQK
jgi:hypothetical protein